MVGNRLLLSGVVGLIVFASCDGIALGKSWRKAYKHSTKGFRKVNKEINRGTKRVRKETRRVQKTVRKNLRHVPGYKVINKMAHQVKAVHQRTHQQLKRNVPGYAQATHFFKRSGWQLLAPQSLVISLTQIQIAKDVIKSVQNHRDLRGYLSAAMVPGHNFQFGMTQIPASQRNQLLRYALKDRYIGQSIVRNPEEAFFASFLKVPAGMGGPNAQVVMMQLQKLGVGKPIQQVLRKNPKVVSPLRYALQPGSAFRKIFNKLGRNKRRNFLQRLAGNPNIANYLRGNPMHALKLAKISPGADPRKPSWSERLRGMRISKQTVAAMKSRPQLWQQVYQGVRPGTQGWNMLARVVPNQRDLFMRKVVQNPALARMLQRNPARAIFQSGVAVAAQRAAYVNIGGRVMNASNVAGLLKGQGVSPAASARLVNLQPAVAGGLIQSLNKGRHFKRVWKCFKPAERERFLESQLGLRRYNPRGSQWNGLALLGFAAKSKIGVPWKSFQAELARLGAPITLRNDRLQRQSLDTLRVLMRPGMPLYKKFVGLQPPQRKQIMAALLKVQGEQLFRAIDDIPGVLRKARVASMRLQHGVVPNLVGVTMTEARKICQRIGIRNVAWQPAQARFGGGMHPQGLVVSQSLKPGTRMQQRQNYGGFGQRRRYGGYRGGMRQNLTLKIGPPKRSFAAVRVLPNQMPDVVGFNLGQAKQLFQRARIRYQVRRTQLVQKLSDDCQVIAQSPPAGTYVGRHQRRRHGFGGGGFRGAVRQATITVNLSAELANAKVKIPNFRGQQFHSAQAMCRRLGLIPNFQGRIHGGGGGWNRHRTPTCYQQRPQAGTMVKRGSRISLNFR